MRCQQLIFWSYFPGFGSSALLLGNPVSCHTRQLANLFQVRVVFLIGYSREDAWIIFIGSLWIFGKYSQGFICQSKSLAMISLFGYNIEYIAVDIRPSQRNNIRKPETCITCKYKDIPHSVNGFTGSRKSLNCRKFFFAQRIEANCAVRFSLIAFTIVSYPSLSATKARTSLKFSGVLFFRSVPFFTPALWRRCRGVVRKIPGGGCMGCVRGWGNGSFFAGRGY